MSESINSNNSEHYGKFVVDNTPEMGEGRTEDFKRGLGQSKYSCGTGKNIWADPTRNTEDDNKVVMGEMEDDTQGGKY